MANGYGRDEDPDQLATANPCEKCGQPMPADRIGECGSCVLIDETQPEFCWASAMSDGEPCGRTFCQPCKARER